jgi:hypothetical protein
MSAIENNDDAVEMRIVEWLAIRKEAGLQIDPDTAEVCWRYAQVLDPYGFIRTCRNKVTALAGSILLALVALTYASSLATYLSRPRTRCG